MPGLDGLAAAAVLHAEMPSCRVLILTTFGRPGYLRRAMEAGVLGFVVKDAPVELLADAVRRVAAGERVVDPDLAAATLAGGHVAADGTRARRPRRRPRRHHRRRHRRPPVPLRGDGAQPPVVGDLQDGRAQPGRGPAASPTSAAGCSRRPGGAVRPVDGAGVPCAGAPLVPPRRADGRGDRGGRHDRDDGRLARRPRRRRPDRPRRDGAAVAAPGTSVQLMPLPSEPGCTPPGLRAGRRGRSCASTPPARSRRSISSSRSTGPGSAPVGT